jgi:hypothetical protein
VTVAHGLPCSTADMRALVGPVPGIDGLWLVITTTLPVTAA